MKTTSFKRLMAVLMAMLLTISMVTSALSVELEWDKAAYDTAVTDLSSQTTEDNIETTSGDFAFCVAGQLPAQASLNVSTWDAETTAYIRSDILGLPELEEGMTEHAFDITILSGTQEWQPDESVTVDITGLDVDENSVVSVYHIPDEAQTVSTFALGEEETTAAYEVVENVVVGDGKISFVADGFSTYYVLAGTQSDNSGNDTFNILRGTSVELTNVTSDNYSVTYPSGYTAENAGVSIARTGNTLTFAALDNAAFGTYTIQISNNRIATIVIMSPEDIFEISENQSVYLTCVRNSTNIPSEPMSGGNYNWTYVTGVSNGDYSFTNDWGGAYKSSPDGFLKLDTIGNSTALKQNLQGQNVIGVIDTGNGVDTLPCVELTDDEWHEILKQFVEYTTVEISNGQGGTTTLTSSMVDEKLEDGSYRYKMYPYVIKLILESSEYQKGWHVDCAIVDLKTYWVSYEYNLPSTAIIQESSDLTRPDRAFYAPGTTGVDVGVLKLGNTNVTGDTSVTIYDTNTLSTSEYKFLYWNTEPDGSGITYNPGEELPAINSNVTLYAIWNFTQTSGTVRITKTEVFEDPNDERKDYGASYTFAVNFENVATDVDYPYTIYKANGTIEEGENITAVASITLANGEYIIIRNAPAGNLTVTETVPENAGYVPSWKVGDNAVTTKEPNELTTTVTAGNQTQVECINTYAPLTSNLTITKTLEDEAGASYTDTDSTFTFNVTIDGTAYSGNYKVGTETKSTTDGTVTIKGSESAVIEGITIGKTYAVTETAPTKDYVLKATPDAASGTIAAGGSSVTFTNVYTVADLIIDKKVVNSAGEELPVLNKEFTFEVKVDNALITEYYIGETKIETENGLVVIEDDETATIKNIPYGASYAVVEKAMPNGFEFKEATENASGTMGTQDVNVQVTNLYQRGNLIITKVLRDASFTEGTKSFTFKIIPLDGQPMTDAQEQLTITFDNPATAANGKFNIVENLYAGQYRIEEAKDANFPYNDVYTVGITETNVVTVTPDDASITVTNTIAAGSQDVIVNKLWSDSDNKYGVRPASIQVMLLKNGEPVLVDDEPYVTIAGDGWTRTWEDQPIFDENGQYITYSVEELTIVEYASTYAEPVVDETAGTLTLNVTNAIQRATLTITKSGLNTKTYPSGDYESAIFTVKAKNSAEDNRTWTVAINGNDSVTIDGVKIGVQYTVTEENDWTWRYGDQSSQDTEVITAAGDTVLFSNNHVEDQWLGGDNYKINIFGKPND